VSGKTCERAPSPKSYCVASKASNAAELFACEDVDGGLIGGASLVANDFVGIINAMP
jgi:triosephosphate isomerase